MVAGNPISRLERKLKRLTISDMERIVMRNALDRVKSEIEDVQKFQMQLGQDANGGAIGVLRNVAYGRKKKQKGGIAPLGAVDLRDTGAFQDAIDAQIVPGAILLDSSDPKTSELIEKYGEEIFGLNEDSKERLNAVLIPAIELELQRFIDQA